MACGEETSLQGPAHRQSTQKASVSMESLHSDKQFQRDSGLWVTAGTEEALSECVLLTRTPGPQTHGSFLGVKPSSEPIMSVYK